jgi:calmodulin
MSRGVGSESNIYGLRPDQLYEIQQAFHEFDLNHNGYITPDEMRQSLYRFHARFNDFDIQRVLSQMDVNRDGQVSYDEFMTFMARVYRGEAY